MNSSLARLCAAVWICTVAALVAARCVRAAQAPSVESARQPVGIPATTVYATFDQWKAACSRLPSNRSLQGRFPPRQVLPLQRFSDFDETLTAFLEQAKNGGLAQATNWVGEAPGPGFFNTASAYFLRSSARGASPAFQPFAQKLELPADSEVFCRGDFHGDIHSLVADVSWLNANQYLRGFSIQRTNFYMLFLGDYTDRGNYGIEVLYTLFRLKLANPDRVFLARGNHEELSLQARYGFFEEGRSKYGADFNAAKIVRAYDFLPVVIYLGTAGNFAQCNHGGMEPGYSPRTLLDAPGGLRFQLLGALNQQKFFAENPGWLADDASSRELARRALRDFKPEDPISPTVLGFMWNDFSVLGSEPGFGVDPGRAFVYGERATQFLLRHAGSASNKVHAVFRAHQHSSAINPMMRRLVASRGAFRHWQTKDSPGLLNASPAELGKALETNEERSIPTGSVWTFNVSPDTPYGEGCNYTFDTFGLVKLAPNFEDWRLRLINLTVRQ